MGVVHVKSSTLPGMSGMVCDETGLWSQNEAKVVCRSAGYSGNLAWPVDPADMPDDVLPAQHYVIKNVKCVGTEQTINQCPHTDMCMAMEFLEKTFRCPDQYSGKAAAVVCGRN
ncbi:hypothetical protein PoB_001934800 [Plakobranchus ocellatus]|uniref:SRCR domain-containing protein n=1 Tax=Plakobranchus ocellatus TaxID=259542 RepID=A0AAV3ZEF8_9GAST|nr:hypothetical protein PoB_001934800 [Plakobranchus ocellatus]